MLHSAGIGLVFLTAELSCGFWYHTRLAGWAPAFIRKSVFLPPMSKYNLHRRTRIYCKLDPFSAISRTPSPMPELSKCRKWKVCAVLLSLFMDLVEEINIVLGRKFCVRGKTTSKIFTTRENEGACKLLKQNTKTQALPESIRLRRRGVQLWLISEPLRHSLSS